MSPQRPPVVVAVARLRAALEQTATALVAADLDRLLQSEGTLELALRSMPSLADLTPDERIAVRDEAARARIQLQRCRRFGDVLLDMVRITFEAQGRGAGYGRRDASAAEFARRSLDARG
jgi:hypothetical protein